MRCLLVSPDFPPPFEGGSFVYIHNLVSHFPGSFDVLTSRLSAGSQETVDPRIRLIRSRCLVRSYPDNPAKLQLAINYAFLVLWFLARRRRIRASYDAIVSSAGLVGNCLVCILARLTRVPVTAIGYGEEITMPLRGRGLKNLIKRRLLNYAYPKFDGFIACCKFVKDTVGSLGLSENKIAVIRVMLSDAKVGARTDIPRTGHKILSVGRLVRRKGFHYLIEAVRALKYDIPDVEVHIVGRGPEQKALGRLIQEHRLERNVFLIGNLDDRELTKLYQESSLFVLPHYMLENGDTEGCPTVFIEASAHGLPVIGGIDGGAACAIDNGITGYLVEPRDAKTLARRMKTLLLDPDFARTMGRAGQEKIRRDHDPRNAGLELYAFLTRLADVGHVNHQADVRL